ncbi:Holliday junction branch migration protein RuvA [Candidatus Nanogingivalis gingivitcus]|jgi:holliday junction DNA helicase ruvA|uniref:Holliday junction branch migration complex subunit RuvA n=1 Tax=Candidatus Nanogingivalis gingivitcus TaxID=2171992 RepID=A0ABY0FLJ0_9BACT|nr:Holliday junction branch migration protein RuvA [Candidatus Nanogingivalis gingivitcus]RYC73025.1 Holliday junction ATP-dependent DNA helicase RuvA [Candidatus Nanogingivalis gingivitcus]
MIAHISGKIAEKFNGSIIVDVSGVGYEVIVPQYEYDKAMLDNSIKLYTYHHIREQSQELFGFSSLAAKKIFELLITVQGIGPKAGIAIMSLGDYEQVRNAIANEDSKYIQKANGVGKKSAERVIVDLKDKVGIATSYNAEEEKVNGDISGDEALEALVALGFNLKDAILSLKDIPEDLPVSERVKIALKNGI